MKLRDGCQPIRQQIFLTGTLFYSMWIVLSTMHSYRVYDIIPSS